jgi:thiamine-phosphate pyrophosphorylase
MTLLPRPCLCLVTHRRRLAPDARTADDEIASLERWLDEAAGRVDLVQLREADLDASRLAPLARRVAARMRGSGTRVLVNDRADVAAAAGADGVHLPASAPPPARVRPLGPGGWLVGRSAHSRAEVDAGAGADFLVFGTVFQTASKPGAPAGGLDALAAAVAAARLPVLAIGGIDPARARACLSAGAAGVAAIGLFLPPGAAPGALGVGWPAPRPRCARRWPVARRRPGGPARPPCAARPFPLTVF